MKKLLIFVIFLVSLLNCNNSATAQETIYQPVLVDDTIRWTVPQISMADGCYLDEMKAFPKDSGLFELWHKCRYESWNFDGHLRSSEDNAELYFRPVDSEEEFLIMDMNLSANDTFHTQGQYGEPIDLIVDSVFVLDGRKNIRFNDIIGTWFGSYPQQYKMFIEGVGPNWGLREREVIYDSPFYFICKHNGDSLCYAITDQVFENCNFREPCTGDGIAELEDYSETMIYPNPFSDIITIECHNAGMQLLIYDCFGRICLKEKCLQKSHQLNMQNYPSGIYIICLINNKKKEFYKIIKEK